MKIEVQKKLEMLARQARALWRRLYRLAESGISWKHSYCYYENHL